MLATGGATAASYRQQNERKRCSLNWSGILLNEMMPCSLVHGRPILCCWQPAMGTTWAQQCGSNNVAARDDEQQCVRKCKQLQLHYIPSTTLAVKGPEEPVRGLITTRACLTGGFSHIIISKLIKRTTHRCRVCCWIGVLYERRSVLRCWLLLSQVLRCVLGRLCCVLQCVVQLEFMPLRNHDSLAGRISSWRRWRLESKRTDKPHIESAQTHIQTTRTETYIHTYKHTHKHTYTHTYIH